MKNFIIIILAALLSFSAEAQSTTTSGRKGKIGWFITPEYSTMFLDDEVSNTVGFSMGLKLFNDHLKIGYYNYGRSGPINSKTYKTDLQPGVTYKGQSSVNVRADHGAFGVIIAPSFYLPNTNIEIDVPVYIGSIGAGFYLSGSDRKTPDNRKVSDWENELFDGKDAAFAGMIEYGVRAFFPTKIDGFRWGLGMHYITVQDWSTYVDPSGDFFNNKFRAAVYLDFGSPRKALK